MDDVIKVSGYRLGTAEVESGLVSHAAVAEAAVIGIPDDVRGHIIYAYCILVAGQQPSDELAETLKAHIRHEVGPIAVPSKIEFVPAYPRRAAERSCGACSKRGRSVSRKGTPARWRIR